MEQLEDLLKEAVRPLTSASSKVEIAYTGSTLLRQPTPNRSSPISGTEVISFLVYCRGRSRQSALKLGQDVRDKIDGLLPESIHPLLTPFVCNSLSYGGEVSDGFQEVVIGLTLSRPYIKGINKC